MNSHHMFSFVKSQLTAGRKLLLNKPGLKPIELLRALWLSESIKATRCHSSPKAATCGLSVNSESSIPVA